MSKCPGCGKTSFVCTVHQASLIAFYKGPDLNFIRCSACEIVVGILPVENPAIDARTDLRLKAIEEKLGKLLSSRP